MDWFESGNYIEAALWVTIGAAFVVAIILRRISTRVGLLAAATFAGFGLSDVVEVQTGAWWRPWWLLLWKAACVGMMGYLLSIYVRTRRAG